MSVFSTKRLALENLQKRVLQEYEEAKKKHMGAGLNDALTIDVRGLFYDENPDHGAVNRAIANLTKKVPMMKYELKLTFEDGGTTTIKADEGASCTPDTVGIFDEATDILTSRLTRVELIGTRVEKKKCSECGCEKDG